MKKVTKAVAVMMIAALAVGSLSVYAAEANGRGGRGEHPAFSKRMGDFKGWGKDHNKCEQPQRQELTEEEKAAKAEEMKANCKKALDEQLAAGKITQEQYDEAVEKLEAGEFGFQGKQFHGNRDKMHGKGAFNGFRGKNGKQAELTEEEKTARLETMKENWKKMLDKQLAEGKITQEQYDEAIAKLGSGEFKFPGNGFRGQRNGFGKSFGGNRQGGNRWQGKGFAKNAEQPAAQAET